MLVFILMYSFFSLADSTKKKVEANQQQNLQSNALTPEEVQIEKVRERYWQQGKETEIGVVQNRLFSKNKKFELSLDVGTLSSDPFLNVYVLSGELGFYFSEYFSLHAMGMKLAPTYSSAYYTLQNQTGATANTNNPLAFYGGELRASLLYGKLSLIETSILYFEGFLSGGAGVIQTYSGNDFSGLIGIGEGIHVNQFLSFNISYLMMVYNETVLAQSPSVISGVSYSTGQAISNRTNWSGIVRVGFSFFFSFF